MGGASGGGAAAAAPAAAPSAVASPRRAQPQRSSGGVASPAVVDLTADSDDDAAPRPPPGRRAAAAAARAEAAAAAAAASPRRAAAPPDSQDDCVIVAVTEPAAPPAGARRGGSGGGKAKASEDVLDLTAPDESLLPAGHPIDGAALQLLRANERLQRELAEARKAAARAAAPGVEAPAHWKLQAQECNLLLRELPLPAAFAAGPPLAVPRREAVRVAEAAEAARVLARFAETPAGLNGAAITRLFRVQNRRLWARYVDRRADVAETFGTPAATHAAAQGVYPSEAAAPAPSLALLHRAGERLLFHGADPGTICAIVSGGFECRIASMGGALGAGSYFAEHASYSNNYSKMPPHAQGPAVPRHHAPPAMPAWLRGVPAHLRAAALAASGEAEAHGAGGGGAGGGGDAETLRALVPPPGQLLMIVARVALGRTGQASPQMRIAPPGYHSVGDQPHAKCSIYAVFDNYQAYPEYVLQYDPARVAPGGPGAPVPGVMPMAVMPPIPAGGAGVSAALAAMLATGGFGLPGMGGTPRKRRRGR